MYTIFEKIFGKGNAQKPKDTPPTRASALVPRKRKYPYICEETTSRKIGRTRSDRTRSNNKENQVQPVKNATREQNKAVSKQILVQSTPNTMNLNWSDEIEWENEKEASFSLDINTNAVLKNSLENQEKKA
ncbi:11510_t:CDS:2 [Scutellospora calospora]|uniref:11510_t:CDS:1 n=1 Tax=Scutellospora calospora TaxID=85575 RepID=A0ACA9M0B0_9GLOM|nr:11510_t:CDS:2 [Scutellospora calospora]